MEEIGLDDCLFSGGVTVIEWAENIERLLPDDTVRITIEISGADGRKVTVDDAKGVLLPLMKSGEGLWQ